MSNLVKKKKTMACTEVCKCDLNFLLGTNLTLYHAFYTKFFFEVGQLLFLKIALFGLDADIYNSAAQKWVSRPI